MQIILLESIERVGKAGEIVAVKDGYANNFLLPKKLAIVANKKNRSELDTKMDSISKQNDIKISEANNLKDSLDKIAGATNQRAVKQVFSGRLKRAHLYLRLKVTASHFYPLLHAQYEVASPSTNSSTQQIDRTQVFAGV